MNKEGEARPVPCRRPLRHGEVAIGVSSDEDRPPADVPRNAHRLTFLVVDESDGRVFQHLRDTVDNLEVGPAEAADHILRRHPVSFLGEGAHEIDAAARHDVDLEVVGAQIVEQLDHRLKDHRSEEHTSELQSLMRISYADSCLKKKKSI